MPVLVTASAITLIFVGGGGGKGARFRDPSSLRQSIERLPEGESRDRALAIAGDLERLERAYTEAAERSLDAYAEASVEWSSNADSLIALLEPQDAARAQVLREVVRLRQSLLDTLTRDQWDQVFD